VHWIFLYIQIIYFIFWKVLILASFWACCTNSIA